MGVTLTLLKPLSYNLSYSYRYFSELRDKICDVAEVIIPKTVKTLGESSLIEVLSPFWELRNHYDNEGYLTWDECEELVKDFEEYESAFKTKYPEDYDEYVNMMEHFRECAEDRGIIDFR